MRKAERTFFAAAACAVAGAGCNAIFGLQSGDLAASGDASVDAVAEGSADTGAVGSSDTGAEGASGESGAADAGHASDASESGDADAATCGPANCGGCCNASGHCVASPSQAGVCGASGNACATCAAGVACTDGICLGCSAPSAILGAATMASNLSNFPSAVAVSGTTVLVGDSGANSGAGGAYLFTQSGSSWSYVATLAPSGASGAISVFGGSVAISGSVAMVAGFADSVPVVFVYNQVGSSWFPGTPIALPKGDAGFELLPAIAIDGTTAVIGSPDGVVPAGVYVSSGNAWTLQASLVPTEAAGKLYAGALVAIDQDTVLVSVSSANVSGETARWADAFARTGTTWNEQGTLAPAALQANNNAHAQFSVAVSGDTAYLASNAGAYVFERTGTTWTEDPTTTGDAGANVVPSPSDNLFGTSAVATPGGILVGDTAGYGSGSVFLFGRSGSQWLQYDLQGFDAGGGSLFPGTSVARSGSVVAVAAPGSAQFAPQGAVLVYSCSP